MAKTVLTYLKGCLICLTLLSTQSLCGQQKPEEVDFIDPMDIPLHLSGNFGEMRRYHFHTGLDIKTQKRIGIPVVAVGEGYVSRIKIGPKGYGKAIYITHPSGYTSVYAHLSKMNEDIDAFVKSAQYDLEAFQVDVRVPEGKLVVAQGDEIGRSGNSGSSGGPHLHFEIRETKTEKPINPMRFGFSLSDDIAPAIYEIAAIPIDAYQPNYKPSFYEVSGLRGQNLKLVRNQTVRVWTDKVGFAIRTHDVLNGNSGRCGVRTILLMDGKDTLHIREIERLDFNTWHQIQAQRMRSPLIAAKKHFQRSYLLPNMSLEMHDKNSVDGLIDLSDGKVHQLSYIVIDDFGNKSSLQFSVEKRSIPHVLDGAYVSQRTAFDKEALLTTEGASLYLPAFSLYEDTYLFGRTKSDGNQTSYELGDFEIPIQGLARVSIDATEKPWTERHYIEINDLLEKEWLALETVLEEGSLKAETESLGEFRVQLDDKKPVLDTSSIRLDMKGKRRFSFTVKDEESGLASIEGYLNDRWILLDYDKKRDRVSFSRDDVRFPPGNYTLTLIAVDRVGNQQTFKQKISW